MAAPMNRMTFGHLKKICSSCANIQIRHGLILKQVPPLFTTTQQSRNGTGKHYDPKWRKLRAAKVKGRFDLPDFLKLKREGKMEPEERRAHMKREGIDPPRMFQERDFLITCTTTIFDPYIPPEGDGKASLISGEKAKQVATGIEKKSKSFVHVRKIRAYEEFNTSTFAEKALAIYKEAHELLSDHEENEDRLHELVTEKAYPEMVWLLQKKTYRWKYISGLEPPRTTHVRVESMLSKENKYGQVTVRLHSQQTLALYDRFGRLCYGSEHLIKDILEYVVFEKYLADENSQWRMHGKIIAPWVEKPHEIKRTLRMPVFDPIEEEESEEKAVEPVTKKDEAVPAAA